MPVDRGCTHPPEGWFCTRLPGHDGPCAALPVDQTEGWHEAGISAFLAFERLKVATTLTSQANAMVALADAMSDLGTWLPGYDYETGTIPEDA